MFFIKPLLLISFFTLTGLRAIAKNTPSVTEKEQSLLVLNNWMSELFNLTKNCVGFSAPVSARAFCYMSIGMYESQVEMMEGYKSLSGQLQGYTRTIWLSKDEQPNWPHVANTVILKMAAYFYKTMPPANAKLLNIRFKTLQKLYSKNISKSRLKISEQYGQNIATEIINWSKTDNGDNAYNTNYPATYSYKECKGCWSPTGPGYLPALQPYWGNNRLIVLSNAILKNNIPFVSFSVDTASVFYKGAAEMVLLYDSLKQEQIHIAKYWDDSPGYSGTPSGHIFSIAKQLSQHQKFSLEKTLHLYALLGIVINDAMIECWNLKYHYNLIRPINYIQKYIRNDFNSVLTSPPFPEFPSGHSYQSGAALNVFIHFFGDKFSFTDSTNIERNDLITKTRRFSSFTEMAEEISMSRFYGGIHFKNTLVVSLKYGSKIGDNCIKSIQFVK